MESFFPFHLSFLIWFGLKKSEYELVLQFIWTLISAAVCSVRATERKIWQAKNSESLQRDIILWFHFMLGCFVCHLFVLWPKKAVFFVVLVICCWCYINFHSISFILIFVPFFLLRYSAKLKEKSQSGSKKAPPKKVTRNCNKQKLKPKNLNPIKLKKNKCISVHVQ